MKGLGFRVSGFRIRSFGFEGLALMGCFQGCGLWIQRLQEAPSGHPARDKAGRSTPENNIPKPL